MESSRTDLDDDVVDVTSFSALGVVEINPLSSLVVSTQRAETNVDAIDVFVRFVVLVNFVAPLPFRYFVLRTV